MANTISKINISGTSYNITDAILTAKLYKDNGASKLSNVAWDGEYSSLLNAPVIPNGAVLYNSTGQNTDGAMTQKATTDELALKAPIANAAFTGIPTAPTATAADNSTQIATTAFVQGEITSALTSVIDLKGVKANEAAIKAVESAKKGDMWLAQDTGAEWIATKAISAADPTAWEKVGFDVDLSGYLTVANFESNWSTLGDLAVKDSATATYKPAGSVSVTIDKVMVSNVTDVGTAASWTGQNYVAPTFTEGTFSQGTLPSMAADIFSSGSLPSFTEGEFSQGALPQMSLSSWSATVSDGELSFAFDAGNYTQGTLPTKAADTFTQGSLPSFNVSKFSAGTLPTKAADTFNAGSLNWGTFSGGTTPTVVTVNVASAINESKFTGTEAVITVQ